MSDFEIILEGADSTSRVLTRQGDESTMEDVLVDLKNFSGKVRIRRHIAGPLPRSTSSPNPPTAPIVQGDSRQAMIRSNRPSLRQSFAAIELATPEDANARLYSQIDALLDLSNSTEDSDDPQTKPPEVRRTSLSGSLSAESALQPSSDLLHTDHHHSTQHPRRRMTKRVSIKDLTEPESENENSNHNNDDTPGQTVLHHLCASQIIDFRRFSDLVEQFPAMVKQQDARGQLPLHILGNNSELINYGDGQKVGTKCAILLMDSHPQGIVTVDADGRMPFTQLIVKWIKWTFDQEQIKSRHGSSSLRGFRDGGLSAVVFKLNQRFHSIHSSRSSKYARNGAKESSGHDVSACGGHSNLDSLRDCVNRSSNRFPPVMVFDEVEWCFQMLSYGMDHLGGKPLIPGKQTRPTLAYKKQREQREALARNVAEIPGILKTILLVESKTIRSNILESSILRRSLLCSEIIGSWLTSMIRYRKGYSSEVALDLLHTLSRLNGEDFVGQYRKMLPEDEVAFTTAKLELYKAVERIGDLIPALLIAGEHATGHAVTTPIVAFIMNRQMARPFTVGTGVGECILHVTAIFAFRQRLLHYTSETQVFINFPWMTLNSVIFWVAINEVVFKLCEYVALSRVSAGAARKVAFGRWSMIEFMGIILALIAAVWSEDMHDNRIERPFMMAFIVGLMWLRVMGFLKVVNEQLATFILALSQMVYDVRFFSLVLLVFIVMFGDMFQLLVRNNGDMDCSDPDLNPSLQEFCSKRSIDSYLQTYAIVVGDLDFEDYNNLGPITFLWFSTTFVGTILLLNSLIAIVTISYANSQESSVILFRRARAQFLASHSVMERFIRPSLSRWTDDMSMLSPIYWCLLLMRWSVLLTFMTTAVWSSLYIYELTAFSLTHQRYSFTGPLIILGIMLVLLMCSLGSFVVTIFVEQVIPGGEVRDFLLKHFDGQANLITKKVVSHAYGVDRNDTEGGEVVLSKNAAIMTRLDRLENLLHQVLAKQERIEEDEILTGFDDSAIGLFHKSMKSKG